MKKILENLLLRAISNTIEQNEWPSFLASEPDFEMLKVVIEYTKDEKFGDYTTNIAMILAKKIGKSPIAIAENLKSQISNLKNIGIEKVEIVAPGYMNFFLSNEYLQEITFKINSQKEKFGNSEIGHGVKINNEFISANPTGPLSVGNGRGGFYGDSLTRILKKAGFEVISEYYINDAGVQIAKLGHSVLKDSEAVYGGDYIDELNLKYGKIENVRQVGEMAAGDILENYIKKTTSEKMQINFDVWMSEKKLYADNFVDKAIEILKEKNLTFESQGALWLRTTDFNDDKDRVLVKENGEKTYFASDCGYILNKIERGFTQLIESWGADHHGYINRFSAAARALGFSGQLKFLIVQMVKVVKDGKEVRMSKRAGNIVYIDDLIDEVGHDSARFFFLMYSPDTHMNFDLGLAKERSQKNPVFYVQYAHARIMSILTKAQKAGIFNFQFSISNDGISLLTHQRELSLMNELEKFPNLIEEITDSYAAHKLPQYAMKLADKFHSFYAACKVIDDENPELTSARLYLVNAARIVLAETLYLIGVSAPEKM